MKDSRSAVLAILLASLSLFGCTASLSTGGQEHSGAGITFVVPLQTSQVNTGPYGIEYRSANLNARTDGVSLVVGGQGYGKVKRGDRVDLTQPGLVKVNGIVRKSARNLPAAPPAPTDYTPQALLAECVQMLDQARIPTQAALDLMYLISPSNVVPSDGELGLCYKTLRDRVAPQGRS